MLSFLTSALAFNVARAPPMRVASRTSGATMSDAASVLIIQNKGGGHGEIGYHLAQQLVAKGKSVTILHEGDGPNAKEAHRKYGDLDSLGVKIIWAGDLSDGGVAKRV